MGCGPQGLNLDTLRKQTQTHAAMLYISKYLIQSVNLTMKNPHIISVQIIGPSGLDALSASVCDILTDH